MTYMIVRHRVKDFDRWMEVFDSHADAQREAGLKDRKVYRDASDPDVVVCMFTVDDVEKARAFSETPLAEEGKRTSGVIGTPVVLFLEEV